MLVLAMPAVADNTVDLRFEETPQPPPTQAERRRALEERKATDRQEARRRKEAAEERRAYRESLSPATRRLIAHLAGHRVERCGLCRRARVDEQGLHCVEQVEKSRGKCGDGCGLEIMIVSAKALKEVGFTPQDGRLVSRDETLPPAKTAEALELAQYDRGYSRRSFTASPVLFCR